MVKRILVDAVLWLISAVVCFLWRLIADKEEIGVYILLVLVMMLIWIGVGIFVGKYRSYKELTIRREYTSTLAVSAVLIALIYSLLPNPSMPFQFSTTVAALVVALVAGMDSIIILLKHYWKYATNMSIPVMEIEQRENAVVRRPDEKRSAEAMKTVHELVCSITTRSDYKMLLERANLDSRRTKVIANTDRFGFLQIPDYEYDTLVDMTLLNDAKGIDKRFCIVNQKLPDNGRYVCCYRPQEYIKSKILAKYPKGINWIVYTFYFIHKRVIPRLMLTSRLYYDVTRGRKRMLSKTEVLGRLYYCGFEVEDIVPMGHIEYVFARRHSQPYPQEKLKLYGPLVKLPRICKDHEIVYFYKLRTMHPYSEYIQNYVFDQHGGMNISDKSDNDFRITTWGRFMRRYWLDELPMLINFLKRDVKLVGVRPLSRAMFEKYPIELQEKRTKVKPGLIPPFYIDHPQTFEELFASEDKYLTEYLEHPIRTDIKYFLLTMRSILFKRMHSA